MGTWATLAIARLAGTTILANELTKMLESWKKSPKMHELSKRTVGEEVLQHESITVLPKLDGWLGLYGLQQHGSIQSKWAKPG